MKLKKIWINVLVLAVFCTSCDNYLKEDSSDLLIPKSVGDYAPVLLGEGYPDNFSSQIGFAALMTDDVEMGPLLYTQEQIDNDYNAVSPGICSMAGHGEYAYIWQADYSTNLTDGFWSGRYKNIMACNVIIEALPEMRYEAAEKGHYRKLAFQAYTLRAYHYFCLVNTYALPYSEVNADKPGVVLRLNAGIDSSPKARATVREIYNQIESDLKKAEEYLDGAETRASKFEITPAALHFLASRVALFRGDYAAVIKAGEKFLKLNVALFDLNSIAPDSRGVPMMGSNENHFCLNSIERDEVVFGFGRKDGTAYNNYLSPGSYFKYEYGLHTSWTGENSLIAQYESDDLRLQTYFRRPLVVIDGAWSKQYHAGQYKPLKFDVGKSITTYSAQAWRSPEVYLNMAEAYATQANDVSSEAIDLLNQLRSKKFVAGSVQALKNTDDFTSKEELIDFIHQERRRELCFEELMRFWDLRRQGMPALEHLRYTSLTDYETYRLPEGSPNYVLPIPNDETAYNTAIVNNQRDILGPQ